MADGVTGLRLRAATSTHVVFAVFFWPLAICLASIAATGQPSAWRMAALVGAVAAFCHLYYGVLEVSLAEGVMTYRTLFGRRSVRLADIARSELRQNATRNRRDPRVFLAILLADGETALRINLKPFRFDEIQALMARPELRFQEDRGAL